MSEAFTALKYATFDEGLWVDSECDLSDWGNDEERNELLGYHSSQNTQCVRSLPLDIEQHRKGDEVLLGETCVVS